MTLSIYLLASGISKWADWKVPITNCGVQTIENKPETTDKRNQRHNSGSNVKSIESQANIRSCENVLSHNLIADWNISLLRETRSWSTITGLVQTNALIDNFRVCYCVQIVSWNWCWRLPNKTEWRYYCLLVSFAFWLPTAIQIFGCVREYVSYNRWRHLTHTHLSINISIPFIAHLWIERCTIFVRIHWWKCVIVFSVTKI